MKASETILQPVLEGTKQYVVPLYQREYSWGTSEWNALWADILDIIDDGNSRTHFMGSIVTMLTHSVPEGVAKHLLIDGQQRLTTLLLLLAAIRDQARQNSDSLADEIDDLLLKNRYQAGNDKYKLLPTQSDRSAFIAVMDGEAHGQESNISAASKHFARKLAGKEAPPLRLLKKVIVENLLLVSISLQQDDNPHLIFESLNAKGRPLTQADLIRNYFFMMVDVSNQDSLYDSYWMPMQELLGDDLTEFIRHYLMTSGVVVKQTDIYIEVKNRTESLDQVGITEFLERLTRYAQYYKRILQPSTESDLLVSKRLSHLNRMRVTVAYPFILMVLAEMHEGRLSKSDFLETLDVIDNYLTRRFVCGIATTGLNKEFPLLYSLAVHDKSLPNGVKEALRTRNYPRDAEFHDRFQTAQTYGAGDRLDRAKLYLERIEESYEHKEPVDFDDLTIEHVMPRTLTTWWKNHLGDQWEIVHETLLNTVGNLTLTGYNSPMSNSEWPRKRTILASSHVELNRYFEGVESWNEEAIRQRSVHLADRALELWPYFGRATEDVQIEETTVTGRSPVAIVFYGQRIPVSTWRDVSQKTLETIADLDEELFLSIENQFPRMVNIDSTRMRTSRKLKNERYVETHLSGEATYRFLVQVTQSVDISGDDWKIEFR